jgi:hypothetical protein
VCWKDCERMIRFLLGQKGGRDSSTQVLLVDPAVGADAAAQQKIQDVLIRGEASTVLRSCASECVQKGA